MTPILENAELGSNLDCQNFDLRNVMSFSPVPVGLASVQDGMEGSRDVLSGSVLNEHVHLKADIDQSKLNLNGVIPPAWMVGPIGEQPEFPYAAKGSLTEFVSRKGAVSGYAGLDANGRLASGNINTGAATGTVSAVKLGMPPELSIGGTNPVESSGSFSVSWMPTSGWLGVYSVGLQPGVPAPKFHQEQFPLDFISDLDCSKFATGLFPVERLPFAIGMSFDHRAGIISDPGTVGDPDEYLGRDMKWHHFNAGAAYQPTAPVPVIVAAAPNVVTISSPLKRAVLFYRVAPSMDTSWKEAHPTGTSFSLSVVGGQTVYAYAAKAGYNNSPSTFYVVPYALGLVTEEEPPPI